MTDLKGLRISVYRNANWPGVDCTNEGISSTHTQLTVIGTKRHGQATQPLPRDCQVLEPSDDAPAVVLVESPLSTLYGPYLEPLEYVEAHDTADYAGPMAGGNFAATIDSRWARLGRDVFGRDRLGAVPVHDRVETWAQYRAMSMD